MPHQPVPPLIRTNAKRMRRDMTDAERRVWNQLRAGRLMGLKFRRQMPVAGYIADFACPQLHLVIEVDGSQHGAPATAMKDVKRTELLGQTGWTVLRFWNDEVMNQLDAVCDHNVAVAAGLGKES
ncbi:MAG: endonuclease domain-containing protein [Notoacmeibacter sp.]|nr:endonuclease domain-containing protein [Notoacmeibacter sp.]